MGVGAMGMFPSTSRCFAVALLVSLVAGCGMGVPGLPTAISCQPYGYTPAPVDLSIARGPVTAAQAEETALALFRACSDPQSAIERVDVAAEPGTGVRVGPNAGQAVWLVRVDATVAAGGSSYGSHVLIEVNQATGVPTVVGQG